MNYIYDPYRDKFIRNDDETTQAGFLCTNCGKGFGGMGLAHIMETFVYCPYCGIRLKGEETDEIN